MASQIETGLGPHAMWGYTPATDLLQDAPIKNEANILLVQPGDIGHILRTISARRRHPHHVINLFVWENQPEVLARHLLLLQVVQDWELPIRQRANTFLEIFGNCCIQERTSRYIARLGKELVKTLFSKGDAMDIVDLSLLKSKERDHLEGAFKYWGCNSPCKMADFRDNRLRHFFGTRYDHRKNLVDWDYTNRVKEVASIIHHKQYRSWRIDGIAYEFGDQTYNQPNRTMISHAEGMMLRGEHRGMKKEVRGFWLDIRVGPFITFGVDCDRPNQHAHDLFQIVNKGTGAEQHRHNTAEVAVYSILSYFWELEMGRPYMMTKKHDIYSGLGEDADALDSPEMSQEKIQQESLTSMKDVDADQCGDTEEGRDFASAELGSSPILESKHKSSNSTSTRERAEKGLKKDAVERAKYILEAVEGVKVHMLTGDIKQHLSKTRFQRHFNLVHMSLLGADVANCNTINNILADDAVIVMSTGRYMVPLEKKQQHEFVRELCTTAHKRGWKPIFDVRPNHDYNECVELPANEEALSLDSLRFSFERRPVQS